MHCAGDTVACHVYSPNSVGDMRRYAALLSNAEAPIHRDTPVSLSSIEVTGTSLHCFS
jgi:hypothetical protein